MSKNLIIGAVIVALILLGGYFAYNSISKTQPLVSGPSTSDQTLFPSADDDFSSDSAQTPQQLEIILSSDGVLSPNITIKAGDSVKWVNQNTVTHQISSDPHPQHTDYPSLNTVGKLDAGSSESLMFPDKGTYKWHDHLNPSIRGTIIVQ